MFLNDLFFRKEKFIPNTRDKFFPRKNWSEKILFFYFKKQFF
jgi:hypothetical protein